jgi:hypothetical protein
VVDVCRKSSPAVEASFNDLLLIPDLLPWNCIDFYCNHRVLFPSPFQPRESQRQIALTGDGATSLSLSNSDILRVDVV